MELYYYFESFLHSAIFVCLIALIKEPYRRQLMVIMLAYAGGAYLNNDFQLYAGLFGVVMCLFSFLGFWSYRFIAVGWILHGIYDWIHYTNGFPLVNGVPGTAFSCAIFDMGIAVYFLFNAPDFPTTITAYFMKAKKA